MVRTISNKSNESNEYERTRIKVRSFVANGYSLRIAPCSDDSFDIRPCSLIIYSNGLKFGRFIRCPSLLAGPLAVDLRRYPRRLETGLKAAVGAPRGGNVGALDFFAAAT